MPHAFPVPATDFITIDNSTTAQDVCAQSNLITTGSLYLLIASPIALLAQIILMLSFYVVWEVSWRHMKDNHRMGGKDEGGNELSGGSMYASAASAGGCGGSFYSAGGGPKGPACPYDAGPANGPPGMGVPGMGGSYGGYGGGGPAYGGGPGGMPSPYGAQDSCCRGSFGVASTNL